MSVFTAVRLHPSETSSNNWLAVAPGTIAHRDKEHRFDHVFSAEDNREVYNASCRHIVEQVVKGYNGTIAAYGQSGSGKTHSLLGTDAEDGILQMAVHHLLELIEQHVSVQYMIKLSAVEVYNENIVDLMDNDASKMCRLVDDKIIYKTEEIIESYEHFLTLSNKAQDRRKVDSTQMNQKSSRSHALFELVVESCTFDVTSGKQMTTVSRLTLVDLAGSENTRTMSNSVQSAESKKINLSLLALSRVISCLAEKPKNTIGIPFRESVLTRILKKVLGGNSQFLLFCCIKKEACTETASTIAFGQKAKKMPNESRKNVATEDGAITALMAQIGDLKRQLEEQKKEAVDQDKQRLEEMFRKVLNSRPDCENTPQTAKPKRRHSIAFGGNSFMSNMNRKLRHSEKLNWNAFSRLDEDDAVIPDSGRSSRMSAAETDKSRPVTPYMDGLNQQGVQTKRLWIEKNVHDELCLISLEMKVEIDTLRAQLKAQSEEIQQKDSVNQKLHAEIEALREELDEQRKLTGTALKKETELRNFHLSTESESDEMKKKMEEMSKRLQKAKYSEKCLKEKYDDMKQHGLKLLKGKDDEIQSQKDNLEKRTREFKQQVEKVQHHERSERKAVEDSLNTANRNLRDKEKTIVQLNTENTVLHEKIEEMRAAKKGVVYVDFPCQVVDHISLLDKLDVLKRQNTLLAKNNVDYREELRHLEINAMPE